MKKVLAMSLSDVVFIMLINVKMPIFVGILKFMSRINFSRPGVVSLTIQIQYVDEKI